MVAAEAGRAGGGSREASITAALDEAMTATVGDMALASARLTAAARGAAEVHRMLDAIENVWIDAPGRRVHLDLHPSEQPKATLASHPGSSAHARLYFALGGTPTSAGCWPVAASSSWASTVPATGSPTDHAKTARSPQPSR